MRLIYFWLFGCIILTAGFRLAAGNQPANWSAGYQPCNRHSELLSRGSMDLGVRISTANPQLAEQFRQAMNFWAEVLDLGWHEDDSHNCSILLVDGEKALFEAGPESMAARSQFPDRSNFQGWIAFNPAIRLSEIDLYRIAVHEIGHMLGLEHSSSRASVMYAFELQGPVSLDARDIASLEARHKLRAAYARSPILVTKAH